MLWEIGQDGCEVRTLRNRLDLDSGHASRLLRSLEGAGMVRVKPSDSDRRIRVATLTRAGKAERRLLDERSDELAESMLAPLDGGRRERLVEAMRTMERLLTFSAVEIREVDPSHPDARQCFRAYFAELDAQSDSGFDPDAGISAEPHELTPPAGCLLIAYLHAEPVGCGAVKHHPGKASEIKRMWVSGTARGLGIGRRMLRGARGARRRRAAPRWRGSRRTAPWSRRSRSTARPGTAKCPPSTTSPSRTTGSKSGSRVGVRRVQSAVLSVRPELSGHRKTRRITRA